jgi:broad specificity phosphatase PhoE
VSEIGFCLECLFPVVAWRRGFATLPLVPGAVAGLPGAVGGMTMGAIAPQHVFLVRSGQTEWDRTGRLGGRADLPLTPEGRAAATSEAARWAGQATRPTIVYHAPDDASTQTAEVFASAFGAKPKRIDDLIEVSLGLWEGRTLADLQLRSPTCCRQWLADPGALDIPGAAETVAEAVERISAALRGCLNKQRGQVASFVLRPVAHAVAECWLRGEGTDHVWDHQGERDLGHWVPVAPSCVPTRVTARGVVGAVSAGFVGIAALGRGTRS